MRFVTARLVGNLCGYKPHLRFVIIKVNIQEPYDHNHHPPSLAPTTNQRAIATTREPEQDLHTWSWRQLLLGPLLTIGALLMAAPFYWTLISSFKSPAEIRAFPPTWWPRQPTLEHWQGLNELSVGSFPLFFRNSLFVATTLTLLILLTSAAAGYVFAKMRFPGRSALFWGILGMMMIPFNLSLIPSYALMERLGWLNSYWALIVPVAVSPFGIFLMRQAMHTIPNELLDAGRIDGASEYQIFLRLVLPLVTASLAALGTLTFIGQWDSFLWPLVVIDDANLYTLPLGLAQFRGRLGTDVGGLAAASMLAVLPVLILYLFAQRTFIEGITLSGLKG